MPFMFCGQAYYIAWFEGYAELVIDCDIDVEGGFSVIAEDCFGGLEGDGFGFAFHELAEAVDGSGLKGGSSGCGMGCEFCFEQGILHEGAQIALLPFEAFGDIGDAHGLTIFVAMGEAGNGFMGPII